MELHWISSLLSLGVGGVLGIVIFFMYQHDRKDTEKRWAEMVDDLIDCRDKENITREAHTRSLTELTTVLTRMNGKK